MLKLGVVDRRDAATGRVRVVFGTDDNLVSMWLPVLQPKTHADQLWWMPDVDEYVACLLDTAGEFGVVLGAIYSADDTPPTSSLEKVKLAFQDGTTLEYDRAAHQLAIAIAEDGVVHVSAKQVTIDVPGDGSIELGVDGDKLVTESWLSGRFDSHSHPGNNVPPTAVASDPSWTTQRTTAL